MDLLQARASRDAVFNVERFLDTTPHIEGSECGRSLTAQLVSQNLQVLSLVTKTLSHEEKVSRAVYTSFERSYGRFVLWSDGYGVSDGQLDESFKKSRILRRATLRLVRRISFVITDRLVPRLNQQELDWANKASVDRISQIQLLNEYASGDHSDGSSSDDASVIEEAEDSLEDIAEDLMGLTTCLAELDSLIESPSLDSGVDGTEASNVPLDSWEPQRAYCDMIQNRFPLADNALVTRLGAANYERYRRCLRQRQLREELDAHINDKDNAAAGGTLSGSGYHDSGLGTSVLGETVMSYGNGTVRTQRVPPIPREGRAGEPFRCMVCGDTIRITKNSSWKRHIFQDLCPWTCLESTCSSNSTTYSKKEDWVEHLAYHHKMAPGWSLIQCNLCKEVIGPGKSMLLKHLGTHLEEISLAALPPGGEADDEEEDEALDSA